MSQRYNQILQKSLSALPAPPPDSDIAVKMKNNSPKTNN